MGCESRLQAAKLLLGVLLGGAHIPAGAAQTPLAPNAPGPPDQATAAPTPGAASLEEIVVTAQRRSENIQSVPITVEAVSAGQLDEAGVFDLEGLRVMIPGLEVQNANGYATPYLRGVGSAAAGPGIENPIAIYVDGVYYAAATSSLFSLNNVSQIEVLKGPQGTLFGRNASGGLIQVTTRDPSQEPSINTDISYGNYDTSTADLYLTGGVAGNLAADIALRYSYQGDGYGTDLTTGEDVYRTDRDLNLRTKWLLTPFDATRITFAVDYENTVNSQLATRLIAGTAAAPFTGPAYGGSPWNTEGVQPFDHTASGGASINLDQDVGFAQLQSITAYRLSDFNKELDLDSTAAPTEAAYVRQLDNQISEEIHLLSNPADAVKWLGGLYYFYADGRYEPIVLTLSDDPVFNPDFPLGGALVNSRQTTQSLAGFAQGTVEVLPMTRLTIGARYTYEKRELMGTESADLVGDIPLGVIASADESKTFSKPTYRVALDHNFAPDVLAFLSFNSGFKSGGFEPSVLTASPFRPETLDAYEAGIKADVLPQTLRVNASLFDYDYKEIQVEQLQQAAIEIINGAGARVYGADIDAELRPTEYFKLTAGIEYLHAYFTSFPDAPTGVPVGGVAVAPASAAGHHLPVSPDFTSDIDANYTVPLASGALDADLVYAYSGGYYFEPDNIIHQPAFSELNGSIRWRSPQGYSVAIWGRNLSNAVVLSYGVTLQDGNQTGTYAAPRTFGITVGYTH